MDLRKAEKLLDETFNQEFDVDRFAFFINELFNGFNFKKDFKDKSVPLSTEYNDYIQKLQSLGVYRDSNKETIEVFAVKLKRYSSVEKARTMQRNSIANYLKKFNRNASLVAFYGDNPEDWRFSFVKVDYELFKDEKGNLKIDEKLTPAKRYSFLVGKNEPNYTCRSQFLPIIENETEDPTIKEIENAFSVEKVTKEFFNEYKELYLRLNESLEQIVENDPIIKAEFEEKNIITADFAKKLMGQIVFIYFLQKKGWLGVEMDQEWGTGPKNFLRTLYDKKDYQNFFNDILEHLFYDALATDRYDDYYEKFECRIPFLNGGLFEPINLYNWRKTDIKIDNKIFEDIFEIFDLFNFTIKEDEPLERIVAVDPEMLGKVFENLLEVKDRKSKGAFYTPREIVHYMCQQSLINYLNTNLEIPKEDIESFIRLGDFALDSIIRAKELGQSSKRYALPESIIVEKDTIDKLIDEVKIVDPAVGSGAFLVGMMNEILKVKSILSLLKDENNINYAIKRAIIENSLYGVDLDSSAVDITKLRFWLSLIVDEEDIEDIKPLPNLDHKIMCGNSLIEEYNGIKLFDENVLHDDSSSKKELVQSTLFDERLQESRKKLKRLRELHKLYFNEQNKKQKDSYREEIDRLEWKLIEETLKEEGNEEAIQKLEQYNKSNSKPFFLWKLYFSEVFQKENPGFDVVIANPPYITLALGKKQKLPIKKEEMDYYNSKFQSSEYKGNTYVLFFEKGINLLRNNGILTFITPNTLLTNYYYKKAREYVLNSSKIKILVNITGKVFEDAEIGGNLITILEKEKSKASIKNNTLKILKIKDSSIINAVDSEEIEQNLFRDIPDKKFLLDKSKLQLVLKIKSNCKNLEDVATFYNGIKTGNNKKFLATSMKNSTYKKVLRGRDISRYYLNFNSNYVLFDKEKLWSNTNEKNFLVKEKIIVRQTSDRLVGAFDDKQYFTLDTTHLIIPKNYNIKYLLTLVNSDLMNFYYSVLVPEIGKTFAEVKIINLKKLPVYPVTLENQDMFGEYADKMIQIKKKLGTEINQFKAVLQTNYGIEKLSKKLEKYYELSLDEYLNEIKKKKVKINEKNIQRNLSNEFNNSLEIINPLINEIRDINSKINDMVYDLYNLSYEERIIVEKCGICTRD